ncbi:MAG: DUF5684 domain-containing protein [Gemmatimonadota bacterium]
MATARALLFAIMSIAAAVFMIATMWKVNEKGGKPGWAAVVPIYNEVVLLQLAGKSGWWVLLYLIPLVNIIIYFIARIDLAKSFGRGVGFGLGLIFLPVIFFPILAWDDPEYVGPPPRTRVPV